MIHPSLTLVLCALATSSGGATNQEPPVDDSFSSSLLSFLDGFDQKRREASRSYSFLLDTVANQTRVDISVGDSKRTTSTLHATGGRPDAPPDALPPTSDWMSIGESGMMGETSAWYNPMYYFWYASHLFHTTTITVSCHDGGEFLNSCLP